MIRYNNIQYSDFIDLLYKKISANVYIDHKIFPQSDLFYCRAALENKFKRKFKLKEVKELIKEMPHASSNTEDIRKLLLRHA